MYKVASLIIGYPNEIIEIAGTISKSKDHASLFKPYYAVVLLYEKDENQLQEIKELGLTKLYVLKTTDKTSTQQLAKAVLDVAGRQSYRYIFAKSTKMMKELISYVAQKLDMPLSPETNEIMVKDSKPILTRSIMAGRVIMYQEIMDSAAILLAPTKSEASKLDSVQTEIEELDTSKYQDGSIKILERKEKERSAVKLEDADIIVSVGRGFKSKDDLKLAFELADLLNAQVGCSRPIAADLKWLPEEHWVGLSGKKVRPKIYIAVGISGQPQHIAGINNAKTIIAINKDPNAPIFKYADYGVVADLYELIPKLIEKLKK